MARSTTTPKICTWRKNAAASTSAAEADPLISICRYIVFPEMRCSCGAGATIFAWIRESIVARITKSVAPTLSKRLWVCGSYRRVSFERIKNVEKGS